MIKRTFDLILVVISIPFWISLILFVAAILKIYNPKREIFFIQPRLGKNGKIFLCYKFKTMSNPKINIEDYLQKNPDENEYFKKYHKLKNDPRVTNIGKFLRRTSLDELPQIVNVLKGEMSLVGPRPYMINERHKINKKDLDTILSIKPGITGLWQVSGRNNLKFKSRIKLDKQYAINHSMTLDILILIKTFYVVLKQHGSS